MSHEMLRQAAHYLQNKEDPESREGGRELEDFADNLFSRRLIPARDRSVELLIHSETTIEPMLVAADFEYDPERREILKDGKLVGYLTRNEDKFFKRLYQSPGFTVPNQEMLRYVYGEESNEQNTAYKVFVKRIRHKLPVPIERAKKLIENDHGRGYRYIHYPKEE